LLSATVTNKSINPFPGLRPFQKNESHLFFGRENHIREILRKLEKYRFVSIVGNSGSGKSSLVRAGILPAIEKKDDQSWIICIMRPSKDPVAELSQALFDASIFGNTDPDRRKAEISESLETLMKGKLGLVQVVRNVLPAGKKLLILVDQFEEIFRFRNLPGENDSEDQAASFVDLLLGAVLQNDVPIYVIMTVRSDFLGDCEQFTGLPEAINDGQFLIPRMNRDEMETSITGPVDFVKGKISPRLVQQLLKEAGHSPDQLPVLQHALMRTWEVWEEEGDNLRPIDIEEYEKTGSMKMALSNHAEEAFDELVAEKRKKLAEFVFKILTLKGPDNRGVRRPTPLKKIIAITGNTMDEIISIVNVFRRADRGFLMPPENIALTENSVLDISHESLMRVWERLKTWVDEEAASAEIYNRICESALLYDKNMAGLWRDPDLQIAVDWRKLNKPNKAWAEQYNSHYELAMRFIDASMQDKKFRLAEQTRRRNISRAAIALFLVVLSALTIWAYFERNKSESNEKLALSEKQKAEEQTRLAEEQKKVAENNFKTAEYEKANAENATDDAELQKRIAQQNAREAELQRMKAELASLGADKAREAAELERRIAIKQKQISDSLKVIALTSEDRATRLRILSIAHFLAIKSAQAQNSSYPEGIKALLALQAYKFNKDYKGKKFDFEIFNALFSAYRSLQDKDEYTHSQHADAVKTVCFSPDGKALASSGNDGKLILWDLQNRQNSITNFSQQSSLIENISFNNEGTKIAASTDDKNILMFDVNHPAQKPEVLGGMHKDKITGIAWYKQQLITASFDMNIRILNFANANVARIIPIPSKPLCISVCESKDILVIGCENGVIYQLDLKAGTTVDEKEKITNGKIQTIDIRKDGNYIACGTSDGHVIIVSQLTKVQRTINAHKSSVTGIRFNPQTDILASSSLDGTIKLFTYTDEQPVVFTEHELWVWAIAFSPDGGMLASGGRDKTVRTYITDQEKLVQLLESKVQRNFTTEEWNNFVGSDIAYERTIASR
jgi:WD40 repeat protein